MPTESNVEQPSVTDSGPKEATYSAQSREQRPEAEETMTFEKAELGAKAINANMERQERFKALQARAVRNPRISQACVEDVNLTVYPEPADVSIRKPLRKRT